MIVIQSFTVLVMRCAVDFLSAGILRAREANFGRQTSRGKPRNVTIAIGENTAIYAHAKLGFMCRPNKVESCYYFYFHILGVQCER